MATVNTPFFDSFPKIDYNINRKLYPNFEKVTDIFVRIGVLKDVLNNTSSYYVLELEDEDTPEILAEKIYGDSGAGWLIIYANNIFDPQFDWPLSSNNLGKYIINKYGSIETAKTTIHHYEKVIERYDSETNTTTIHRLWINGTRLTQNTTQQPFDYYYPYYPYNPDLIQTVDGEGHRMDEGNESALTMDVDRELNALYESETFNTYNIGGKTIQEKIYGREISCYDYEEELNDAKRTIKAIKAEYYPQIMTEFKNLLNFNVPYMRRLV